MRARLFLIAPVAVLFLAGIGLLLGIGNRDQDARQSSPLAPGIAGSLPTLAPTPLPTPSPAPLPPLTLADIFPARDVSTLDLDPSHLRTVVATGDVIPARYTDAIIRARGDDFLYPVEATKDITSDADLTVVNLEAPLIESCPYHDSGFTFCGRPGFTAALQAAGVDVATLENNHIGNYGRQGIGETKEHLEAAGVRWTDEATPAVFDVRGLKIGLIAFNGVIGAIDRAGMADAIQSLRAQADIVIVAVHWGAEYVSIPQAAPGIAPDDPVEIGHLAIDSGASLVIGNHPHRVQAVETYRGHFIAYAHGNFIFDQMWSHETRVSVIGRYTFYDTTLVGVEYVPVLIEDWARPVPMGGAEAQAVLDGMQAASAELAGRLGAE